MLPDCHSILAAATVKRTLSNGRFAAALIVLALGLPSNRLCSSNCRDSDSASATL
jgi:hypothetical protein